MNDNKILIKVPASEPPKESREYPCIVKLIDTEIYEQIYFNNISGEWSCYTGTVIAWLRPASIQEIKKMFGLFDKEEMKKAISFGRDYDYYEASILDENEDTIENWFRNFYPKQLNYNTDQNGKENA